MSRPWSRESRIYDSQAYFLLYESDSNAPVSRVEITLRVFRLVERKLTGFRTPLSSTSIAPNMAGYLEFTLLTS
jgi:hypothetical protein